MSTSLMLVLLLFLAGGDDPPGALTPADPDAVVCPVPAGPLEGEILLDPGCAYQETFVLEASQTVLDCRGARLEAASGRSVLIRGQLEDVVVRDCHVGGGGMRVQGPEREDGEDDDALRARSPKGVVFEHNTVKDTSMTGTFVGSFVTGVEVRYSHYENTSSSGIYLEYGSQSNKLHHNLLKANGFFTGEGFPRPDWTRREGVAVDASAFNLIEDNTFEGNAFGGVLLYKNCWEHHSTDPKQEERKQHSDDNIIRNTTFIGGPFGVWVAARQARDLGAWDCGDPTPYDNPVPLDEAFPPDYPMFESTIPSPYDYNIEYFVASITGGVCLPAGEDCDPWRDSVWIWEDFAKDNTIQGNTFQDIELAGIRVEDDGTKILDNIFLGDFEYIYLGTPFRARYLGRPIENTIIAGNRFEHPDTQVFEEALALVPDEHTGTVISDNTPLNPLPEPTPEPSPEPSPEPRPDTDAAPQDITLADVADPLETAQSGTGNGGCALSGGVPSSGFFLLVLIFWFIRRKRQNVGTGESDQRMSA